MLFVLHCFSWFLCLIANSKAGDNSNGCGIPGEPSGGEVTSSSQQPFKIGAKVNYSCAETDYLLGDGNRTCGPNRKWTGSVPACLSPGKFDGTLDNADYTHSRKQLAIVNNYILFFDHKHGTCCQSFEHGSLRIWMTFKSSRFLEGVRVVFPMSRNHKFTVGSDRPGPFSKCVESGSGNFVNGTHYQVTFSCSSKEGPADGLSFFFEEMTGLLSICEIYLFFRPDDSKCDKPDAPNNGKILKMFNMDETSFTFNCDPGLNLSGSTYTSCAENRTWIFESPVCIKTKGNHHLHGNGNQSLDGNGNDTFDENKNHSSQAEKNNLPMEFVYGVVAGDLGIILIGGIVIALYCIHRKRREKRLYRHKPNNSSQRSNSFDVTFRRDRVPSVRYSEGFGFRNKQYSGQEERPRSDIPDILGHENVLSLQTVRAIDISPSRAASINGHIYAVPVYDVLEDDRSKSHSDLAMTDNELYQK